MIDIKSGEEIEKMREGGRILGEVVSLVLDHATPGTTELELDALAEKFIKKRGAEPGFKRVRGYKNTICISVNDVVVHGIPSPRMLQEGDIVGVDCGVYFQGFHTDMAETRRVSIQNARLPKPGTGVQAKIKMQNSKDEIDRFIETGKRALSEAIKVAKAGNRIGHISKVIQDIVEAEGYGIVRSLIGHGIGRQLHEEPEVPGFLAGSIKETPILEKNMTIAIEVIYNRGGKEVMLDDDNWTIRTKDGSLSGLFERSVAITANKPIVLTHYDYSGTIKA